MVCQVTPAPTSPARRSLAWPVSEGHSLGYFIGGIEERVLAQVSIPLSCLDLGMPVHGIRIDDYLRKRRRVFYLGARTHGRISSRALSTCAALTWRVLARALGIHGIVGEQAQVFEDVVTVV